MSHPTQLSSRNPPLAVAALATALSVLTQCAPDDSNPATAPDPATGGGAKGKIERFDQWRGQRKPTDVVTCYAFFTGDWYQLDGRTHYFVSEPASFEIPKDLTAKLGETKAVKALAAEFRKRVKALVKTWPEGPKVTEGFAEVHVTTDADAAEAEHNDFLAHRHNDTVDIHRLWIQ